MIMKQVSANQTGVLLFGPGGCRLDSIQTKLNPLTPEQFESVTRAKKFATEQGIKHIMAKQLQATTTTTQQQPVQQKALQKHQALVLMCRVYVGSISFEVREEMIKTAFSPYGTIKSVNMSWDPVTLKHKGFAFVEYELPEAAQLALEHMNTIQLGGRQIKVGRPSNMPQAEPVIKQIQEECKQNNRIYVSNIHADVNEQDLADLFEPFGEVRSCKLALTPNTEIAQHRGCGFIEFKTESAATEALTMNDQLNLGGNTLHLCRATTPADNVSLFGTLESGSSSHTGGVGDEDIQAQLERTNKELSISNEVVDGNTEASQSGHISNGNVGSILPSVIVLKNMVTSNDELDDDLQLDVYEECSKHGAVRQVVIYIDRNVRQPLSEDSSSEPVYLDEVKIFVKYKDAASGTRALEALNGRFFAGRKVSAERYDLDSFRQHCYTR